jgi:hypothetical protein
MKQTVRSARGGFGGQFWLSWRKWGHSCRQSNRVKSTYRYIHPESEGEIPQVLTFQGGRGQSHNSNILTRVSLERSATACVGPHGDAMGMEHEKNGATQAIFGYG